MPQTLSPHLEQLRKDADAQKSILCGHRPLLTMKHPDSKLCFSPPPPPPPPSQCITTSDNMVNSLLPILLAAVRMNRRELAVKYLDKAATWIRNLIKDVEEIVDE